MKIGIIVAMRKELDLLLPLLEGDQKVDSANSYKFYCGKIGSHEVVAMQCGIGKVNAAISTYEALKAYEPDLVLNTGVAGGCDDSMHPLDVVVATEVAYHDVWCGPETAYGAAAGLEQFLRAAPSVVEAARRVAVSPRDKLGLICSGDKFISRVDEVEAIKKEFPAALAVDMESGAIAQVCTLMEVPFGVVRVISDTPGAADNISQYENFWTDAPRESFELLRNIIAQLA